MTDFYACLIIVDSAIEIVWMKLSFEKNKIIDFYERMKKNKTRKDKVSSYILLIHSNKMNTI
jgi:hypothetical protein